MIIVYRKSQLVTCGARLFREIGKFEKSLMLEQFQNSLKHLILLRLDVVKKTLNNEEKVKIKD